jgi:hypothetical protein
MERTEVESVAIKFFVFRGIRNVPLWHLPSRVACTPAFANAAYSAGMPYPLIAPSRVFQKGAVGFPPTGRFKGPGLLRLVYGPSEWDRQPAGVGAAGITQSVSIRVGIGLPRDAAARIRDLLLSPGSEA